MKLRPKVKVIGTATPNLLGSWVGIAYKQLERMRRQYDIGAMNLPHFKWEFALEEAHISIVAKRVGRDEITIRPLPSCPKELLSGLSDPQQPTMIDVIQPDESIRQEFSRYWTRNTDPVSPDFGLIQSKTSHKLSAASLINNCAGLYTGRMRALVQDQLGRGGDVGWGYGYAKTHGIYTASDGVIWAIQISATGVFAARLSLCPFDPADTVGGFSTRRRSFPKSGTIELASAETIAPAYAKAPLWPQCGWAFSESGAKAANVVIDNGFPYMRAYLYEITITETVYEGIVRPGLASVVEVEQDYFWGQRVTHIKVPQYPVPEANIPMSLVSIDWWRGQHTAPSNNIDTPVHVYYNGETRIVSRYIVSSNDNYTHDDGSTGTSGQHGFKTTVFPTVPVGFTTSGAFTQENSIQDPTTFWARSNPANFRQKFVLGGAVIVQTRTGTWSERSNSSTDVLTIPFGDRESVYHARRTSSVSSGNASATAGYTWTEAHYKDSNILNSREFERIPVESCAGSVGHPDTYGGGRGDIVYDAGQPIPVPQPGGPGRFGTKLQENGVSYFMLPVADCDRMVLGASPNVVGATAFSEGVANGDIDGDVWEYGGVVDVSNTIEAQPGNERWAERWKVLQRLKSTGGTNEPFPGTSAHIRVMPYLFISATAGDADKRPLYTHSLQPISENEDSLEFGVALGTDPAVLSIDAELWDELKIYDASGQNVQRILVVARDASITARQLYTEKVYPQFGSPIGTLLAGDEVYPLASVTAPMASWIGKP